MKNDEFEVKRVEIKGEICGIKLGNLGENLSGK